MVPVNGMKALMNLTFFLIILLMIRNVKLTKFSLNNKNFNYNKLRSNKSIIV